MGREGEAQFAHVSSEPGSTSPVVVSRQRSANVQHQPQQLRHHAHRGQRGQQRGGQEQWQWCETNDGASERQVRSDGELGQVWGRWARLWLHPVNILNQG